MKACVIGNKKKAASTMKIFKAVKRKFKSASFIPIEEVLLGIKKGKSMITYDDENLLDYDVAIPRIGASKTLLGFLVVSYLKNAGVYVPMNPESIIIAHNKYMTLEALNKAKIPVPETYLTASTESAKKQIKNMKVPIVMKLLGGSGGKGVMFSNDKENAIALVDTLGVLKQPLFIEEYIGYKKGDIRAFVVGNEVVASMKRMPKKGEKRANLSGGGKGLPFKLTDEMENMSIKSAHAIGAEICGVDILESSGGPLVVEVNIAPGLKISDIANVDVAKKIAEYVYHAASMKKAEEQGKGIINLFEKYFSKLEDVFRR